MLETLTDYVMPLVFIVLVGVYYEVREIRRKA